MTELAPQHNRPEILRLRYPAGWAEILHAPDAEEYRQWMQELTVLTQNVLSRTHNPPEWATDGEAVMSRWQRAVEQVACGVEDTGEESSEVELIEIGLVTLRANIKHIGWEEEGVVFLTPDLPAGNGATIDFIDIREIQSYSGENS